MLRRLPSGISYTTVRGGNNGNAILAFRTVSSICLAGVRQNSAPKAWPGFPLGRMLYNLRLAGEASHHRHLTVPQRQVAYASTRRVPEPE